MKGRCNAHPGSTVARRAFTPPMTCLRLPDSRSALLTLVLSVALLATGACGPPSATLIRIDGDLDELEATYQQRARANPGDADALARLGAVQLRQGRPSDAVRSLGRASSLRPTNPEIARWHGEALLTADRPLDAHREFARALTHDPTFKSRYRREVEPRLFKALAAQASNGAELGRLMAVISQMDPSLLDRYPEATSKLYEAEGDRLLAAGSNHEAIAAYDRATGTGQPGPDLRFKLGSAHAVLRQLDRATANFDAWIAAAEDAHRAARIRQVAELLHSRFMFDLARKYYEQALQLRPHDRALRRELGTLLLKARRWDAAREALDAVLESNDSVADHVAVAKLYLEHRRVDEALATWTRVIALAPDDSSHWLEAARIMTEHGRLEQLQAVIEHPDHHLQWGEVELALGHHEAAASRFERAIAAGGGPPDLLLRLAMARHHQGRPADRDATLQRYLSNAAASERPAALTAVARTYETLKVADRELAAWKELAALQPQSRDAAFALARIHRGQRQRPAAQEALARWAAAHAGPAERAGAWLEVAAYWVRQRRGAEADAAVGRALAEGDTTHHRDALLLSAEVHRKLLRGFARAEELYARWIETAPAAERYEARQKVAGLVRGVTALRRFRNQLLEDMVRERPDDARTHYVLGESYLTTRPPQAKEAAQAFERYIALSANKVDATLEAGARLTRSNAFAEAARLFSKLSPEELRTPAQHLTLAKLFLRGQVNDRKRAREHLVRYLAAVQTPPESAVDELYSLGNRLNSLKMFDMAVEIYRRLLQHERNKTRVLKPLGHALLGLGKPAEADEVFRSYLEAMSNHHRAVRQVADAFYSKGFYRRARTYYESIFTAQMRRRLAQVFPRLCDIYRKLDDKPGLLRLAERYVEMSPSARALSSAARQLELAGLRREALGYWGRAAEREPRSTTAREQQARLALQLGDVDEAERLLSQLIGAQRGKAVAWVQAGQLLADAGHDDRALRLFAVALEQGADGGPIHLARAEIHLRAGRFDDAHADLTRALARAENLDKVLSAIRDSYLKAGQITRYVDLLRRASALYPGRAETWLELGDMALLAGKIEEAQQYFTRYVERDEKGLRPAAARLWAAGDLAGARRLYEQALSSPLLDGREKALAELLIAFAALGQPELVPEAVNRFLLASNDPGQDLQKLAATLEQRGYLREAIRFYARRQRRSPTPDGLIRLGRLWLRVGEVDKAAPLLERYVQHGPGPALTSRRLPESQQRAQRLREVALAYEAHGFVERALALLHHAAVEHADNGRIHVHRARLLLSHGNVLDAMEALEGLVRHRSVDQLDATDLDALYRLLRQLGREREALDVLRRTPPSGRSLEVSSTLVRLALRLDDPAQARQEISRVLGESPAAGLRLRMGISWFRSGHYDEAAELLLEVLEPGRGGAAAEGAVKTLLLIARLKGDPTLLGEVAARLDRLIEERTYYHRLMSEGLLHAGFLDEAVEHAEEWVAAEGRPPSGGQLQNAAAPSGWAMLIQVHLRRGDGDSALKAAQRYVAAAQNKRAARVGAARLLRLRAAYPQALALYEEAAQADQSDRDSRLAAAEMALELGERERARRLVESFLSVGDVSATSLQDAARLYAQHGLLEEAEALFARLEPIHLSGEASRPLAWLRQGDIDRARAAIDVAIGGSVDPLVAELRYAALYLRRSDMPAPLALELADRALARRPDPPHPVGLLVRACALAELGRDDEARSTMASVLALGGADDLALIDGPARAAGPLRARVRSLYAFAEKAVRGQRVALASWALEVVQGTDPSGFEVLNMVHLLVYALRNSEDLTESARRQLAEVGIATLTPLRTRATFVRQHTSALSAMYEQVGDLDAAVWVYRDALQRFPEDAALYNELAYLMAQRELHLEDALGLVRHAIQLEPTSGGAFLDTEGWVLFKLGRYPEARERLEQSLRYHSINNRAARAETLYHLGATLKHLGQADEARATLRRAVRLARGAIYGRKAAALLRELTL